MLSDDILNPTVEAHLLTIERWQKDVFLFADETLNMRPSEPIDELRGAPISYKDGFGKDQTTILFDLEGHLVYHDLAFYTKDMFKHQDRKMFKKYKGTRYTWQQTVALEAYNRAVNTFDKDSYDASKRWISIVSGHGIGKTATLCTISLHFLLCFFGAQIGATANSENQLKDIYLKELYFWKQRLPAHLADNIVILDDMVRIVGTKDWYLRARVSRSDKPEALAGLHGKYVLLMADEASGIDDMTFQVMKGALTGENYIVVYTSNGTRTEGEFFDSHKPSAQNVHLSFSSEDSPIVEEGYCEKWEREYGIESDEYQIRVRGGFASTADMDGKGWIPLFANVTIHFEPERGQIINGAIMGVDPAGGGRDSSIIILRDNVYLKEALNEKTSNPKDLARKIETVRDAYNVVSNDIGIEAFGVGGEVVGNVNTKIGENVNGLLTDDPRLGTEHEYNSWKSELGWLFRKWVIAGGIIITNNKQTWMRELEKIKYKRDAGGRIALMPKLLFKKEYGFSPDKFDAAIHTFFKDHPTRPHIVTKQDLENQDLLKMLKMAADANAAKNGGDNYSSM